MVSLPPALVRRLILRGLIIWIGLEVLVVLIGGVGTRLSGPDAQFEFRLHSDHLIPIVIAALVAWFDLVTRDEQLFFANLGLGTAQLVFFYLIPAAAFEMVLLLV